MRLGVQHYLYHAAKKVMGYPELHYVIFTIFLRFTNIADPSVYLIAKYVPSLRSLSAQVVSWQLELRKRSNHPLGSLYNIKDSLARLSLFQYPRALLGAFLGAPTNISSTPVLPFSSEIANQTPETPLTYSTDAASVFAYSKRFTMNRIPAHLHHHIQPSAVVCDVCQERPCFDGICIRYYELSMRDCVMRRICSEACAKHADSRLANGERQIYRVEIPERDLQKLS
jgi:hypothetical protein